MVRWRAGTLVEGKKPVDAHPPDSTSASPLAGVAQLVEHHLAKVDVESSSLFARSIFPHPRRMRVFSWWESEPTEKRRRAVFSLYASLAPAHNQGGSLRLLQALATSSPPASSRHVTSQRRPVPRPRFSNRSIVGAAAPGQVGHDAPPNAVCHCPGALIATRELATPTTASK
jgi:hypothetical protein